MLRYSKFEVTVRGVSTPYSAVGTTKYLSINLLAFYPLYKRKKISNCVGINKTKYKVYLRERFLKKSMQLVPD